VGVPVGAYRERSSGHQGTKFADIGASVFVAKTVVVAVDALEVGAVERRMEGRVKNVREGPCGTVPGGCAADGASIAEEKNISGMD
jgi:hypothetical protein